MFLFFRRKKLKFKKINGFDIEGEGEIKIPYITIKDVKKEVDYLRKEIFNYKDEGGIVYDFDHNYCCKTVRKYAKSFVKRIEDLEESSGQQVQSDWNVTDSTSKAFIKNKPTYLGGIGITLLSQSITPEQVALVTANKENYIIYDGVKYMFLSESTDPLDPTKTNYTYERTYVGETLAVGLKYNTITFSNEGGLVLQFIQGFFSGNYSDLNGKPDLSIYATWGALAENYYTKTDSNSKYVDADKTGLTEQTRDTLFNQVPNANDTKVLYHVEFTTSEKPPLGTQYVVEVHNTSTTEKYGYIIAKNRLGCYISNLENNSWGAWKQLYSGIKDFNWTYFTIDSDIVSGGQWRICCKSGIVYIEAQAFTLKGHGISGAINNARIGYGIPTGYEPKAIEVRGLLSYNYGKELLQNCWISANSTELYSFQRQNDYTQCRLFISYPVF